MLETETVVIMKIKQEINGNSNQQTIVNVNGDLNLGISKEEVVNLIRKYAFTDADQIIDIVKDAIESIKYEIRKAPDKRVFVPMIQQLSYNLDDGYVKMVYTNLLASSMDKTKIFHPSFVSIINQMSSDEFKILDSFSAITAKLIPLVCVKGKTSEADSGVILKRYFSDVGYGVCNNPENIDIYLENMERLKLIEIPYGKKLSDEDKYNRLKKHPFLVAMLKKANFPYYDVDKMYFHLTEFGVEFILACRSVNS